MTHASRFDPANGTISDYVLMARRPQTPREDAEHPDARASHFRGVVDRQVVLTVPMLAQGDQYAPPVFTESVIHLGEDGARELIDQLATILDWLREPYAEDTAENIANGEHPPALFESEIAE